MGFPNTNQKRTKSDIKIEYCLRQIKQHLFQKNVFKIKAKTKKKLLKVWAHKIVCSKCACASKITHRTPKHLNVAAKRTLRCAQASKENLSKQRNKKS